MKNYQTAIYNKVVTKKNKKRRKHILDNLPNDMSHLESINETGTFNQQEQHKNSYYEEEKSQRT